MSEALETTQAADVANIPLDQIDLADPTIYQNDTCWAYFERLRREDPVHRNHSPDFGDFWSVTRFADIQYVDKHHELFSSEPSVPVSYTHLTLPTILRV